MLVSLFSNTPEMRVECEGKKVRYRVLLGGGEVGMAPTLLERELLRDGKKELDGRVMSQWNYCLGSFAGQYVPTPLQYSHHTQMTSAVLEPVEIGWGMRPNCYMIEVQPNSA